MKFKVNNFHSGAKIFIVIKSLIRHGQYGGCIGNSDHASSFSSIFFCTATGFNFGLEQTESLVITFTRY